MHLIKSSDVQNYIFDVDYQKIDYKEYKDILINLKGEKQIYNASLCLEAVNILKENYKIPDAAIREGLKTVIHHARFEKLLDNPLIIYDGAHNEPAIKNLKKSIEMYYNGKEKKEPSIIKLGDRYFNTDYLKTVQNFLGPLSNVKMQVIPEDNKSRVKFESGNKAVVLLPIQNGAELENRIINTNDIKKSLEDIIMFYNDFEDEDEEIEDAIKNDESLFNDYSAENPSEFNSIKYKVANAFEECGY